MSKIAKIEMLLSYANDTVNKYQDMLRDKPDSIFAKGMLKNTSEQIVELKANLSFEKKLREKEIIDFRLNGKGIHFGILDLKIFGQITTLINDTFIELARKTNFGARTGGAKVVANIINLNFETLMPGSTHVVVSANTAPDLFGNSIIEETLKNTFAFLESTNENILEQAKNLGGNGIKKLNGLFEYCIKSNLEFDFEWNSPNEQPYKWQGKTENLKKISQTISNIRENLIEDIEIEGIIITLSLKGHLELKSETEEKNYTIRYPLELVESVKVLNLGDNIHLKAQKKSIINTATGQEKIDFELQSFL